VITKIAIDERAGETEFGMVCQRLVPWAGAADEPPAGAMACFLPPAGDSAPDCHDQDEVMVVLSGHGSVDIGPEQVAITTGELIVIPRNQEHVVHNPGEETLSWLSFYWPLHEPTKALREPATGAPA
jgi:mannose-6-phosphate isomerase-like protein (cupin superfamily)